MKVIIDVKKLDTDEYLLKDSKHTIVIPGKFCELVDDNIRLTEEQAIEIVKVMFPDYVSIDYLELNIKRMKEKGWIIETKTAKEEAEKIAVELEKNKLYNLGINNVLEMIKYYREAIKEAEEK